MLTHNANLTMRGSRGLIVSQELSIPVRLHNLWLRIWEIAARIILYLITKTNQEIDEIRYLKR